MTRTTLGKLPLRLGTARWTRKGRVREALVAPLPSDSRRLVDLNLMETARLQRLGEGRPELLAEACVSTRLRALLESGPRGLHRARLALAYAEKWHRRGDLPEELAPWASEVQLLACLPDPAALNRFEGTAAEDPVPRGPGAALARAPQPTLAAVGGFGGLVGHCLALEDLHCVVLGAWLSVDQPLEGCLALVASGHRRTVDLAVWEDLLVPPLMPAEVRLLPAPRLRALPGLWPDAELTVHAPFETLALTLEAELLHPTLQ